MSLSNLLVPQPSEAGAASRASALIGCLLLVVWFALKLPLVNRYSFEWDSAGFSMGALKFDPLHHHPHPPGFPLWILCTRLLAHGVGSPNTAQIILAMLFAVATVPAYYGVGRRLFGDFGALTASALLLFSPTLQLYSSVATTYTVEMCASCWCAYWCVRLIEGESRLILPLFVLLGVTAGFRLSTAVFLSPLVLYSMFRAGVARHWRPIAGGIAIAAVSVFLCYLPVAIASGGFAAMRANNRQSLAFSISTFPFTVDAPLRRLLLTNTFLYFFTALSGVIASALAGWAWGRIGTSPRTDGSPKPRWDNALFWTAWIVPNLLFLFVHCPKSGYVLFTFPPLTLLLLKAAGPRKRWECALVSGVAASLFVALFPVGSIRSPLLANELRPILRSTPEAIRLTRDLNRELDDVLAGLHADDGATLLVCLRHEVEGPNVWTLMADRPEYLVAYPDGGQLTVTRNGQGMQPGAVPRDITRIAWLNWPGNLPESITSGFPNTVHLYSNPNMSIWLTKIGEGLFDVTAGSARSRFRIFRL